MLREAVLTRVLPVGGQRRKVRGQTGRRGGEGGSLGVAVSEVGVRVNRSAGLAVPIYTITLTLTCTHI